MQAAQPGLTGNSLDRSTLTRGVASFEHDDDSPTRLLDPILKSAKLHLQLVHLLVVNLSLRLAVCMIGFRVDFIRDQACVMTFILWRPGRVKHFTQAHSRV